MHDDWDISTSNAKSIYGNKYTYETLDEDGRTISSGVAYEPKVGSDECALKTAIFSDPAQNFLQSSTEAYKANNIEDLIQDIDQYHPI